MAIIAERRVRRPRDGRGTGDLSSRNRLGRVLKEAGIVYEFDNINRSHLKNISRQLLENIAYTGDGPHR